MFLPLPCSIWSILSENFSAQVSAFFQDYPGEDLLPSAHSNISDCSTSEAVYTSVDCLTELSGMKVKYSDQLHWTVGSVKSVPTRWFILSCHSLQSHCTDSQSSIYCMVVDWKWMELMNIYSMNRGIGRSTWIICVSLFLWPAMGTTSAGVQLVSWVSTSYQDLGGGTHPLLAPLPHMGELLGGCITALSLPWAYEVDYSKYRFNLNLHCVTFLLSFTTLILLIILK